MNRRFLAGFGCAGLRLALLCCFLVSLKATPVPLWDDKESGAKEESDNEFFGTAKVWDLHLELSSDEYQAMQPPPAGFNFPGLPAPPRPRPRRTSGRAHGTSSAPNFPGPRAGSRWQTRPTRTSASATRGTLPTSCLPRDSNDL